MYAFLFLAKTIPKIGAKMTSKRAPEMASLERPQTPKTLCFPYVSARNGQWQGPQKVPPKGTPKGIQKGARNEARKGAEAGIELKIIIVLKI